MTAAVAVPAAAPSMAVVADAVYRLEHGLSETSDRFAVVRTRLDGTRVERTVIGYHRHAAHVIRAAIALTAAIADPEEPDCGETFAAVIGTFADHIRHAIEDQPTAGEAPQP